jgi:hypothetical protein
MSAILPDSAAVPPAAAARARATDARAYRAHHRAPAGDDPQRRQDRRAEGRRRRGGGTYDALLQRGGLFAELYRKLNGRERIARFIDSTRKTLWVQNER